MGNSQYSGRVRHSGAHDAWLGLNPRSFSACSRLRDEVMTLPTAFLVGPPTCVEPGRPDLTDQLTALGFTVVREVGELPDLIRSAPAGRVALIDHRIRAHQHALRQILVDPRDLAGAHPAGVIVVADEARPALLSAVAQGTISQRSAMDIYVGRPGPPPRVDLAPVLAALESEISVRYRSPEPLVLTVANNPTEDALVTHRMAAVNEEHTRFSAARGDGDGPITTALRPWSAHIARWLAGRGIRPNQVTTTWFLLSLTAGLLCVPGTRTAWVAAALALAGSVLLDQVDGDLARYTCLFARHTGMLTFVSRLREYVVIAGLATGATVNGAGPAVWGIAAAVPAAQAIGRYARVAHIWGVAARAESATAVRGQELAARPVGWLGGLSRLTTLHTGDRLAVASVFIAATTPLLALMAMLVLSMGNAAARIAGSLMSTPLRDPDPTDDADPTDHSADEAPASAAPHVLVDVGPLGRSVGRLLPGRAGVTAVSALAVVLPVLLLPLASMLGPAWLLAPLGWYVLLAAVTSRPPLTGSYDWLLPVVYRFAEYGVVIVLAALANSPALVLAFAYVVVCACYHEARIDSLVHSVARADSWRGASCGGHEARLLLLGLGGVAGFAPFTTTLAVLTVLVGAVTAAERLTFWRKQTRPGRIRGELSAIRDRTGDDQR